MQKKNKTRTGQRVGSLKNCGLYNIYILNISMVVTSLGTQIGDLRFIAVAQIVKCKSKKKTMTDNGGSGGYMVIRSFNFY